VLVANLARTSDDGRWRTIDSRRLYAHARTAGAVYQSVLRRELTERLGVGWGPVSQSTADLAGVPREWVEGFSKRRAAIVAEMVRRGESSAAAAQVAPLDTRQAKDGKVSESQLRAGWRARAATLGVHDVESWARALTGVAGLESPDVAALHDELVGDTGLTANASTFTRRDVVQAIASRLPTGGRVADIEAIADATLTGDRDRIVQLDTSGPRTSGT
jgi:hypothetical protein